MASILGIKPGNAIVRQYKNARNIGRIESAFCATTLGFGSYSAVNHNLFGTVFNGIMSCSFLKKAVSGFMEAKALKPEYKAIVERAKSIKKAMKPAAK